MSSILSMRQNNLASKTSIRTALLMGAGLSTLLMASVSTAQTAEPDEVITTGTRQVIQSSLNMKRQATTVVDGLSADEIGEIPGLSIGEALETLTGASSHRENGGATEISIRGLGPFLSSTVFNGREATNGSGDRSVNFSQFPSELMSKLAIYKTQDASLIEGGVAGQIHLETLKPLDYGKRRFQFGIKGNINPDQLNIDDSMEGDLGHRITGSYVDQFELSGGGEIGISIGAQTSATSQPEQEIRSSSPTGSSRWACLINGTGDNADQGFTEAASRDDDCEDDNLNGGNDAYDTTIDPETGLAVDAGEEYTFAMSQRGYRQNDTSDKRDAIFGAVQWAPTSNFNVNLDAQYSVRTQAEDRYDLTFDNSRRNTRELSIGGYTSSVDSLLTDGNGETLRLAYETEIATGGEIYERKETYQGFGLNGEWNMNEKLTATGDIAYSKTNRREIQQSMRVQSGDRFETLYSIASGIPQYTIEGIDLTDITSFDDDIRLRVDTDVDRDNTVKSARLDFNYALGNVFADSIDAGVRISELGYKNLAGQRDTYTLDDGDVSIYGCATDFAESNFLSSVRDGDLFTFVDSDGSTTGSASSWATFDNACLSQAIRDGNGGVNLVYPDLIEESASTTDVTETTIAAYLKANFVGEIGETPIRGNYGVRVINTDVDSIGYRPTYTIDTDVTGSLVLTEDADTLEKVSAGGSYTQLLPSVNFVADLSEDLLFRGGIFKALSRADPADMSNARSFSGVTADDGEIITDVEDLLTVTASGNPNYKPLTSWNADAAMEWYANEDSLLAVGLYYKNFRGGFENAVVLENFTVDGVDVELPVTLNATNEDTSNLYGVEVTATHRFTYLPKYFNGLGFKVSYNYAESDFEFDDSLYGDIGIRELDGTFTQTNVGLIESGNIPGLSNHVLSAQLYYQIGDLDLSAYYKYRDEYFQPYTSNGTRLRYIESNEVVELRASYKLNKNYKASVEVLNLFDEARVDNFYQTNNFGQSSVYGPRIFFGLRGKF